MGDNRRTDMPNWLSVAYSLISYTLAACIGAGLAIASMLAVVRSDGFMAHDEVNPDQSFLCVRVPNSVK